MHPCVDQTHYPTTWGDDRPQIHLVVRVHGSADGQTVFDSRGVFNKFNCGPDWGFKGMRIAHSGKGVQAVMWGYGLHLLHLHPARACNIGVQEGGFHFQNCFEDDYDQLILKRSAVLCVMTVVLHDPARNRPLRVYPPLRNSFQFLAAQDGSRSPTKIGTRATAQSRHIRRFCLNHQTLSARAAFKASTLRTWRCGIPIARVTRCGGSANAIVTNRIRRACSARKAAVLATVPPSSSTWPRPRKWPRPHGACSRPRCCPASTLNSSTRTASRATAAHSQEQITGGITATLMGSLRSGSSPRSRAQAPSHESARTRPSRGFF